MKPLVSTAFFLIFAASAAFGHGDEDHGTPAPVASQTVSPRATAVSENFEVLAVLEDGKLVLYLDRFASNEPVTAARVEIEGGGLQGLATESSPGVYAIDAATITPSKHPLTITVETGDDIDLLAATLDASLPQAAAAPEGIVWPGAVALLAGGVIWLGGVLLWLVRRNGWGKGVK